MFFERDVLVYREQVKDRIRRREEDRLLAAAHREGSGKQTPDRRRQTESRLRLLVQKLLPAR